MSWKGQDDDREFRGRRNNKLFDDPAYRVDYKDVNLLRQFVSERGKIVPRRISGLSAKRQREVATAIQRARMIALMPFAAKGE
jgi:small subunit ribosomal protein S18